MRALGLCFAFLAISLFVGCVGGGDSPSGNGSVTLTADTGIDFVSGSFQEKGNWNTSDIYATAGSNHLKLASGGEKITDPRPVNFFLGPGGIHETFDSLAAVPDEFPDATMKASLVKAKQGNAFVVQTASGGYAKGWISASTDSQVTIQWVRLK
jgi:hypothetical protein